MELVGAACALGLTYSAVVGMNTYRETQLPRKSSEKQILKQQDMGLYIKEGQKHAALMERMASKPDTISLIDLELLRRSPFYDGKQCKAELRNALTLRSQKAKFLLAQDLIQAPCLTTNSQTPKDSCTSQEIIGDLYKALSAAE